MGRGIGEDVRRALDDLGEGLRSGIGLAGPRPKLVEALLDAGVEEPEGRDGEPNGSRALGSSTGQRRARQRHSRGNHLVRVK